MTIYKGKGKVSGEKNLVKKQLDNPPIVLTADDAFLPLTQSEYGKSDESLQSSGVQVLRNNVQPCERRFMRICAALAVLTIFVFAACLGYFARQKFFNSKPYVDTVHVQFHEYRRHVGEFNEPESRIEGGFYEQVEIDWKTNRYEKISVPPFIDVQRATILHDFFEMWTAIVDHDSSHCFIAPLNGSITYPPDRFMEHIYAIRDAFNVPSAKVERQLHKVVTPPLENLSQFGNIIATQCHYYDTYKLVKADEPLAMSKRFACRFSGKIYSLGGTGYPLLVMVALDGCV